MADSVRLAKPWDVGAEPWKMFDFASTGKHSAASSCRLQVVQILAVP